LDKKNLVIGITGASGALYARTLLRSIPVKDFDVHVVASSAGRLVYEMETGLALSGDIPPGMHAWDESDFTAPFASGTFPCAGMAVVPCTMGTLGAIATGISQNLIHRAADVCLKERRPLVLVPRETPLNRIHLRNMLKAAEAGAIILPAMPGFYHRPRSVEEIAAFMAARILDQLGIPHELMKPWEGPGR
jgi:4-hydroxy-3-polyprenylbenzoate decarboxylase